MRNLVLILAAFLCLTSQTFAQDILVPKATEGTLQEMPYYIPDANTGQGVWDGPQTYGQVMDLINQTGQFALVIWTSDGCPWCDKLKDQTLAYHMPRLQRHYIVFFADVNRNRAAYDTLCRNASSYYYPNGEKWSGKKAVPVVTLIGPWKKDYSKSVVVYGAAVGFLDRNEFAQWNNSILLKFDLVDAPDNYRWNNPAPRPYAPQSPYGYQYRQDYSSRPSRSYKYSLLTENITVRQGKSTSRGYSILK